MRTYRVLYNASYGGFDIDNQGLLSLLRVIRPYTRLGEEVWKGCVCSLEDTDILLNERIVLPGFTQLRFVKPPRACGGVEPLYIKHTSSGTVLNLRRLLDYIHRFREHQEVIQGLETAGILRRPMGTGFLLTADVPEHCSYTIHEYDGLEKVHVHVPIRQALVDLLHLLAQTGLPKDVGESSVHPLHPWTRALLCGSVNIQELDEWLPTEF